MGKEHTGADRGGCLAFFDVRRSLVAGWSQLLRGQGARQDSVPPSAATGRSNAAPFFATAPVRTAVLVTAGMAARTAANSP
jgi:hypothetical protein